MLSRFSNPKGSASKKTIRPAEQDRPDIARKADALEAHQGKIDASRLVFIDETWIKTNMALRGWALTEWAASRSIGTSSALEDHDLHRGVALRPDQRAVGHRRPHQRPNSSPAYVEKVLAPTLRKAMSSSSTISAVTRASLPATQSARQGHALLPAAYSPDLNPIEQVFAKLKPLLRKAAERTSRQLGKGIGQLLDLFSKESVPTISETQAMRQPNKLTRTRSQYYAQRPTQSPAHTALTSRPRKTPARKAGSVSRAEKTRSSHQAGSTAEYASFSHIP